MSSLSVQCAEVTCWAATRGSETTVCRHHHNFYPSTCLAAHCNSHTLYSPPPPLCWRNNNSVWNWGWRQVNLKGFLGLFQGVFTLWEGDLLAVHATSEVSTEAKRWRVQGNREGNLFLGLKVDAALSEMFRCRCPWAWHCLWLRQMCTTSPSSRSGRQCAAGPGDKKRGLRLNANKETKWRTVEKEKKGETEWSREKRQVSVHEMYFFVLLSALNSPRHTPPGRPCPPPGWQSLRPESGAGTGDLSLTSC